MLYGYDFRDDARQEVEWVNLRVTGIGPIRKPEVRQVAPGRGAETAVTGTRPVFFDDWVEATVYDRARLGRRRRRRGAGGARGVLLDRAAAPGLPRRRRPLRQPGDQP